MGEQCEDFVTCFDGQRENGSCVHSMMLLSGCHYFQPPNFSCGKAGFDKPPSLFGADQHEVAQQGSWGVNENRGKISILVVYLDRKQEF